MPPDTRWEAQDVPVVALMDACDSKHLCQVYDVAGNAPISLSQYTLMKRRLE
jgi:hypothetical protein